MNKNNLRTVGRQSLAVAFAFLMVTSMVLMPIGAGPVGVAAAQEDTSGDDATICDGSSLRSFAFLIGTGAAGGVYCIASGWLDSPDDATSSTDLMEGAYVQHGGISEVVQQMQGDVSADSDEYQIIAYSDAEKAVVDARYEDESASFARAGYRAAANDVYSDKYAELIGTPGGHNAVWQEIYTWSRATHADPDADTIITVEHSHTYPTTATTQFRVNWVVSENSALEYDTVTLPNGDEVEYVTRITDIHITRSDDVMPDGDRTDVVFSVYGDGFHIDNNPNVGVKYEGVTNDEVVDSHTPRVDSLTIRGHDPNGGTDEQGMTSMYKLLSSLDDDRVDVLSDADVIQDRWYTEVAAGEVPPDEYYGPREFYQDYGASMDTSVAAQLYFYSTLGFEVSPDMTMIVDDSQAGELEGGVLVPSADSAPLVYDTTPVPLSNTGDVTLDSHAHEGVFSFDAETNETSITFVDNSDYDTANISIDVQNVNNETVAVDGSNITATFSESDMQDDDFVIFRAVHDDGDTVTESGTYVLFADATIEEVRGFVQGNEYSESYDMLYVTGSGEIDRQQLSSSWTLTENYDANGSEKAVAVTMTGVNTDFTGTSAQERIEEQQNIRDAVDERDDLTAGGGAGDDGISPLVTGLIGLFGGVVIVVGLGFGLLVLYLVGRVTSIA